MWALHLPGLSENRSLNLHLWLLQQNKPLCIWQREIRVRTVPQKVQKYWLTINKVKLFSKLCSQSTFSKSLFDDFQFGVGKQNIYEKCYPCSVLNTATMASCCGHISSHRRISQSHITSLAGITFNRDMPPTSSTATGTVQRNFTSQFHASMTPNANSGPPGNHTPIARDRLQIWVFVGSGEEKDIPLSKNKSCASVHGFSDHLDHHGVWSCVKGRTHSSSWV